MKKIIKYFLLVNLLIYSKAITMPALADPYDDYYQKGKQAEASADLKKAASYYDKAVSINPNKIEAAYALAKILSWNEKSRDRAVALYDSIYPKKKSDLAFLRDYGEALYWGKQYDRSIRILLFLLNKTPNDLDLLKLTSDTYLASGNFNDSKKYLNKILLINPKNLIALKALADVNFWTSNYIDAANNYKKLLSMNFSKGDAKQNYIYSLIYSKQFDEADKAIEKLNLSKLEYYKAKARIKNFNKEIPESIEYYKNAFILNPNDKEIPLEYAEALITDHQTNEARDILENYILNNPKSIRALKSLSTVYTIDKDYDKAIQTMNLVLSLTKDDLDETRKITTDIANAYMYSKKYDEAIDYVNSNKNLLTDSDYYITMARCFFYGNNPKDSVPYYEKAIVLDPIDLKLKSEYVDALLSTKDYEKAEKILLSLNLSGAENEKNLFKLADITLYGKEYDKSNKYLDDILKIDPQNAEVYYKKGEMEFYQGKLAPALEYYEKAYSLPNGQTKQIITRMAELSSYTKNIRQAKEMFDLLKTKYPEEELSATLGTAQAYKISGSLYKAKDIYEEVLQLDPENLQAQLGIAYIHNDLNLFLHALKILEPLHEKYPDNNEIKETLARSYTLLGRKDKAIALLGKTYLEENKDKSYQMKEIYWNNRNKIVSPFKMFRESGDLNNKLDSESYGGIVSLYPRGNFMLSAGITANPYRTLFDRAKVTTTDYMIGFEAQPANALNLKGNLKIIDYSNSNVELNGGYAITLRASDHLILKTTYERSKVDESYLSLAGIRPLVGPFANSLVGKVTDNYFTVSSSFVAPYYKFDFTSQYSVGFKDGENISSNLYHGLYTNTGFILVARDTYAPLNVLRVANSTSLTFYEHDRSGFGGADLRFNPIGSDGGAIYPNKALNIAGTGGYFSPGYNVSSLWGFDMKGYFKKINLRYDAGFYAGLQNVKHDSTTFVYTPRIGLKFNEFGHVGADVSYMFARYGSYNQHLLTGNMILRF